MGKIHCTKKYLRARKRTPEAFAAGSLRTIDPGRRGHTKLIVGCPKGRYQKGRCQVGTELQAVLHSRSDRKVDAVCKRILGRRRR